MRKRIKSVTLLVGVSAILFVTTAAASTPGLGKKAKDGDFTFVATDLRCNIMRVGRAYGAKPSGQYCAINISVYNHSNTSQFIDVSAQIAFDKKRRQYPADTSADIYSANSIDLKSVNPGITVHGTLYFDMPKRDKPSYFMFHDSSFSGGVRVNA